MRMHCIAEHVPCGFATATAVVIGRQRPAARFQNSSGVLRFPTPSGGQDHDGLDTSSFYRVLCCNVNLIESVGTNESVEGQTALPVQPDEVRNELSGVAVSLIGTEEADTPTEQVRHVHGDLRAQRRRADHDTSSCGSQRGNRLIENRQPAAGLDRVLYAYASGQFE